MEGRIKPCSNMIDDAEKAHQILVDTYNLNRRSFPSYKTKGLKDKNNPLNTINTLHKFFKKFIVHHGSYDREEIQDWCNLFSFMYNHNGIMSLMITDFLKPAISTKKVMRYRKVMQKNPKVLTLSPRMCKSVFFIYKLLMIFLILS